MSEETIRHTGIVRMSVEVLAGMMHLPAGHKVVGVRDTFNWSTGDFEVLVEGPSLPPTPAYQMTPQVRCIVTETENAEDLVPRREITVAFEVG